MLTHADMVRRVFGVPAIRRGCCQCQSVYSVSPSGLPGGTQGFAISVPAWRSGCRDDLVFDHQDAAADFHYKPEPFDPSYLVRPR